VERSAQIGQKVGTFVSPGLIWLTIAGLDALEGYRGAPVFGHAPGQAAISQLLQVEAVAKYERSIIAVVLE
jgi:hypothetical protein